MIDPMYNRGPDLFAPPPPPGRPIAWVTWFLVASTVGVFLLQLTGLQLLGSDVVGDALAFSPQAVAEHRYWTVLTYAWAHAVAIFDNSDLFWLHIVANMIPLICLGPALEEFLGHLRYLGLYLGGAIVAALAWYALNQAADEPVIGASGAVFAVIAGVGVAYPRITVTLLLFYVVPMRMSMGVLAVVVCGLEAVQAFLGLFPAIAQSPHFAWMTQIAHSAHLGGAAFGFFYVLCFRLTARRYSNPYLSN